MTDLTLARRPSLYGALIVLAAMAAGAALVARPDAALGLIGVLALCTLALRLPGYVPVYLLLVCVLQPILMRLTIADESLLVAVKRLDEFSLAILLPLALARHAARRQWPLPRLTVAALAALTVLGLAGSMIEGTPVGIVALDAFLLFRGFLFFITLSAFPLDTRAVRFTLRTAAVVALVIVAIGLLDLLLPGLTRSILPYLRDGERLGRLSLVSTFNHEGESGWFFAFFASASYGVWLVYRRRPWIFMTLLFVGCTLLTLRRKAIAALVVVFAVSVLLDTGRAGLRLRTAVVSTSMLVAMFLLFGDVLVRLFGEGYATYVASRDPTQIARNVMYIAGFEIAVDHFPLGVGFGRFGGYAAQLFYSPVYFEYGVASVWGHGPRDARFLLDAFWPHVLGQFGFIGVPLFALALSAVWWPLLRESRSPRTPLAAALAVASLLTFAEAWVESVALQVFEATLSSFFVFGLPALAYAHRRHAEDASAVTTPAGSAPDPSAT